MRTHGGSPTSGAWPCPRPAHRMRPWSSWPAFLADSQEFVRQVDEGRAAEESFADQTRINADLRK